MSLLRQHWIFLTALLTLLIGGGYGLLGTFTPSLPPADQPIYYWLILLHNYTSLPAAILVLMGVMVAAFFWFPQFMVKGPHYIRDGAVIGLSVLALVWSANASWPLMLTLYRELDTQVVADQAYVLGVQIAPPEKHDNVAVLCTCDSNKFLCHCTHLHDAALDTFSAVPRLSVESQRVAVYVGDKVIYEK